MQKLCAIWQPQNALSVFSLTASLQKHHCSAYIVPCLHPLHLICLSQANLSRKHWSSLRNSLTAVFWVCFYIFIPQRWADSHRLRGLYTIKPWGYYKDVCVIRKDQRSRIDLCGEMCFRTDCRHLFFSTSSTDGYSSYSCQVIGSDSDLPGPDKTHNLNHFFMVECWGSIEEFLTARGKKLLCSLMWFTLFPPPPTSWK